MRQRGRKSAELIALGVDGRPPRLAAPVGLTAKERALFAELVDATAPEHFRASDMPLLIGYVQATALSRSLARDSSKIGAWEKATRTMAMLATRLRLSPQSRSDPKTTAREQQNGLRRPWLNADGSAI